MPRKWKNSDSNTYDTERSTNNRLERLRKELITNYNDNKKRKPTQHNKNNYNKKNKK